MFFAYRMSNNHLALILTLPNVKIQNLDLSIGGGYYQFGSNRLLLRKRKTNMDDFKKSWDVEMAMAVLENKTVDSKTWADAVEWLLLYGPPEIKEILGQASSIATGSCFPELRQTGYTPDGQPCYDMKEVARSLGISKEEALEQMAEKESKHGVQQLFDKEKTHKLQ